jgi:hypothetical protein
MTTTFIKLDTIGSTTLAISSAIEDAIQTMSGVFSRWGDSRRQRQIEANARSLSQFQRRDIGVPRTGIEFIAPAHISDV